MYASILLASVLAAVSMAAPEQHAKRQEEPSGFELSGFLSTLSELEALATSAAQTPGEIFNRPTASLEDLPARVSSAVSSIYDDSNAMLSSLGLTSTALPREYSSYMDMLSSGNAFATPTITPEASATDAESETESTGLGAIVAPARNTTSSVTMSDSTNNSTSSSTTESTTDSETSSTESQSSTRASTSTRGSASPSGAAAAATTTTSNPAARPTGAIAAGFAGVVGVLGVVAAL